MRSNPFALWLYIWWFLRRAKVFQWDGFGNSDRHGWTPVDFDWLSRIPSDKWIPSESIEQYFCLLWCSSDFRYSFASWLPVISLPLEGVRNRLLPIQLKKKSFPSESLGVYWTYMTVFVYFPHRMLQTQDWDSAAFSTTCLQSMPTAVNVSHELSLKSSQKYFTYVLLTLSRLAKTNPWPVSSAGHRNAREVLSYLSSRPSHHKKNYCCFV